LEVLSRTFGCSKGSLPFTYLGLPLSISRPRAQDFMPLITKCERKLSGISSFLNQAGRLQMTNGNGKLPNHIRKGSFWRRDTLKFLPKYKSIAKTHIENGESSLFWLDSWISQPLATLTPELLSFAKNKHILVHNAFNEEDFTYLLQIPLSQHAFH
jgi:hypothetical protein